jgi:protocatechuate 3,4-dioxygenase beta subunit
VTEQELTRRRLIELGLALPPLALVLDRGGSILGAADAAAATPLPVTPWCDDGDHDETPPQTEGPFFTPSSPRRKSLLQSGMAGTRLTLTGYVLSTGCKAVPRALLDFWHADASGAYDNEGFRLRGHQFTDAKGRYSLETIVPGLYTGRTRHIHVKAQAPGKPVLTTQLYFPGEPRNSSDGIFDSALLVRWHKVGARRVARFDFVLDLA